MRDWILSGIPFIIGILINLNLLHLPSIYAESTGILDHNVYLGLTEMMYNRLYNNHQPISEYDYSSEQGMLKIITHLHERVYLYNRISHENRLPLLRLSSGQEIIQFYRTNERIRTDIYRQQELVDSTNNFWYFGCLRGRSICGWVFGDYIAFMEEPVITTHFGLEEYSFPEYLNHLAVLNPYEDLTHYDKIKNLLYMIDRLEDYNNLNIQKFTRELVQEEMFFYNQIWRIYKYLNSHWEYVNDPNGMESYQPAEETFTNMHGDCDDYAILVCAMVSSIGGVTRIVGSFAQAGGHAYPEVYAGNDRQAMNLLANIKNVFHILPSNSSELEYFRDTDTNECWISFDRGDYPGKINPYTRLSSLDTRKQIVLYKDNQVIQRSTITSNSNGE